MMDGRALRSVADKPGMPAFLPALTLEHCALLVESRASEEHTLNSQCDTIMSALSAFEIPEQVAFTTDSGTVATLWGIRKGMFPAVGAVREAGTTVIIEDVAFPVERLAAGVENFKLFLPNSNTTKPSYSAMPSKVTFTLCLPRVLKVRQK